MSLLDAILIPALLIAVVVSIALWRRSKRNDAELKVMRAELVDSTRLISLGNLVAGLVHEINTPMGALSSNHDVLHRALGRLQAILADERVDEHELEEVRKIVRAFDEIIDVNTLAVDRMAELVKNLRNFGRPDQSSIAWADLHEGIESTLAIMRHELKEIDVVREYGQIPRVLCRPQQINQVFVNLIMNAVQASKPGGNLIVRTESPDTKVKISVIDHGCGIAPDVQKRIFEPGFTTKSGRIGMGMGLLICRQIIEDHGGSIQVRSVVDKGSEFTITLPVAPASLQSRAKI